MTVSGMRPIHPTTHPAHLLQVCQTQRLGRSGRLLLLQPLVQLLQIGPLRLQAAPHHFCCLQVDLRRLLGIGQLQLLLASALLAGVQLVAGAL